MAVSAPRRVPALGPLYLAVSETLSAIRCDGDRAERSGRCNQKMGDVDLETGEIVLTCHRGAHQHRFRLHPDELGADSRLRHLLRDILH